DIERHGQASHRSRPDLHFTGTVGGGGSQLLQVDTITCVVWVPATQAQPGSELQHLDNQANSRTGPRTLNVVDSLHCEMEADMSNENVSRRRFLSGVAAGSTGAALVSLPGMASTGGSGEGDGHTSGALAGLTAPVPPGPVTMESYPIVEPGKSASLDH